MAQGEYQRALSYYKQSLQRRKVGPHTIDSGGMGLGGANGSPSPPGYVAVTTYEEAELKYKEGKCYVELEDVPNAIRAMEAVPPSLRPLQLNLLLGKVHTSTGSKASAQRAYRDALKQEPTALEAIGPLVALGVGATELKQLISGGTGTGSNFALGWVSDLIDGMCSAQANDFTLAARAFGSLEAQFPSNLPCLLHLGKVHMSAGRLDDASYYFTKARISDTLNLDAMDDFALLIKMRHAEGDSSLLGEPTPPPPPDGSASSASQTACAAELNRLAHDLTSMHPVSRPEPWVTVALYQDAKGDPDKALSFVNKALTCAPRHTLAHALKGQLLLARGQPDQAIVSYFKAKELRRDLSAYKGLVEAYLAANKLREALIIAKEASSVLHASPGALTLLGQVLATPTTTSADKERAVTLFRRALSLDPTCVEATRSLALLHAAEKRWSEAAEVLNTSLRCHNANAFLHAQLADVLTSSGQHAEALAHYHTAMSLNPNHTSAQAGLERLEKLMRGAPDEASENGDEDDEDRSEEVSAEGSGNTSQYM
jgi:anaphase-promoting complex subunit 7